MFRRNLLSIACVCVVIVAADCGAARGASSSAGASEPTVLIRGTRVFDGRNVIASADVLVRGSRILEVGAITASVRNAEVVNGAGMTLLPGLIDNHVHLWDPKQLRRAAVFGVTTLIDMGENASILKELTRSRAAAAGAGVADFRSAGSPVTAPGGHGTEYGYEIPTLNPGDDVQAFVDARLAEGSEFIKIMYTPDSNFPSISKDALAKAVAAAHHRGKLAAVHIGTVSATMDAIEAGVDVLAHVFADRAPPPGFAAAVAARDTAMIATLTVHARKTGHSIWPSLATDAELSAYCSAEEIVELKKPYVSPPGAPPRDYSAAEKGVRALRGTHALLAGTDAGYAHGVSLHGELELLVRAGIPPAQALAGATALAAERWRLTDRGRIAPGMRADLLLVRGDPTSDIRATRAIEAVWIAGQRVRRRD